MAQCPLHERKKLQSGRVTKFRSATPTHQLSTVHYQLSTLFSVFLRIRVLTLSIHNSRYVPSRHEHPQQPDPMSLEHQHRWRPFH